MRLSFLEHNTVRPATAERNAAEVDEFERWADIKMARLVRSGDLDVKVAQYLEVLYFKGCDNYRGLAALKYGHGELTAVALPMSYRSQKGFRRLAPDVSRAPLPHEAVMAIIGAASFKYDREFAIMILVRGTWAQPAVERTRPAGSASPLWMGSGWRGVCRHGLVASPFRSRLRRREQRPSREERRCRGSHARDWLRRDVKRYVSLPGACHASLRARGAQGGDDVKAVAVTAPSAACASAGWRARDPRVRHGPAAVLSQDSQKIIGRIVIRDVARNLLTRILAWAV